MKLNKRESDDSYRHVLKYTGVFGGVQGLKILADLVRNKFAAKLLGKAGMGLNGLYLNIADILHAWTNFGIPFYAVRRVSELYEEGTDDDMRRFIGVIRTWSLWSALLGALLCFLLASWLSAHYIPGGGHTFEVMLLSLYVASMPIETVECSILKGLRQLRTVALIEVLSALSALLLAIPLYFLLGLRGIALALVLCGWAVALIHLFFSTRLYSYRVRLFSRATVREGWPLVRIGVPYVLASVAAAMATGEVFNYLSDAGQVGLYRAGFGLLVTYAGLVFKAMEADYFPRLSGVNHDTVRLNHAINQQIDVCVLLMAPILILFIMLMPWLVPVLWTHEFMPVVPMTVCAAFYMFFKAVTTPIAYTSLAKADSWLFLLMECIYDAAFVLMLRYGYGHWGLTGAGLALSAAALFDLVMIWGVYGLYYHFRMRIKTLALILPQGLLLAVTVISCMHASARMKHIVGLTCLLLSVVMSVYLMKDDNTLVRRIKSKLRNR